MKKIRNIRDITAESRLFSTHNKEYVEIFEKLENYTIASLIAENKEIFDILCIINYLMADLQDLLLYNIETEEEQKDFEKITKIKDTIMQIRNKYM